LLHSFYPKELQTAQHFERTASMFSGTTHQSLHHGGKNAAGWNSVIFDH